MQREAQYRVSRWGVSYWPAALAGGALPAMRRELLYRKNADPLLLLLPCISPYPPALPFIACPCMQLLGRCAGVGQQPPS